MRELDDIILENKLINVGLEEPGAPSPEPATPRELPFDPLEGPPFKCAWCFEPIDDECCKTEASLWHPDHFNCCICSESLVDKTFYEVGYNLYCQTDFELVFLHRCRACKEFISEVSVYFSAGSC